VPRGLPGAGNMSATNMVGETERSRDPAASAPPDDMSMQDDEYTCVLRIDGSALDLTAIDAALDLRGQHDHINRSATRWRSAVDLQRWQYPMGDVRSRASFTAPGAELQGMPAPSLTVPESVPSGALLACLYRRPKAQAISSPAIERLPKIPHR